MENNLQNTTLCFGLLHSPVAEWSPGVYERVRGFTLSWLRYGYFGPIFEAGNMDLVLAQAREAGYSHCLVLQTGDIISEHWHPEHWGRQDFFQVLHKWIAEHDFQLAGIPPGGDTEERHSADGILLVNLRNSAISDKPLSVYSVPQQRLPDSDSPRSTPVRALPDAVRQAVLHLQDASPTARRAFAAYIRQEPQAIHKYNDDTNLSAAHKLFLSGIEPQLRDSRNGVFLFNIESYADIEQCSEGSGAPLDTVYTVAAGFKPNRILECHGFNANTRVVYFDYSEKALAVKQFLLENWNGEDFPIMIRELFRRFPHPETFYQLWAGTTPETVQTDDIEYLWRKELERWGGAAAFAAHWAKYRQLEHCFVHCSVLNDCSALLELLHRSERSLIWWSNAFFTVFSNWHFHPAERKQLYDKWIHALAAHNPDLLLYGSDYNNISVNNMRAGRYAEEYFQEGNSYLRPRALNSVEMKM